MKKIFRTLVLLCVALATLGAFSCKGKKQTPSASNLITDESVTVTENTFTDGGTPLSLWTFQAQHVGFYRQMADKWNEVNPERAINLSVTHGESHFLHSKLLATCQEGKGTPDIADIEVSRYGTFLKDDFLLPLNDAVSPYEGDVVMSRITMYGNGTGNYYGIDFHLGASVAYYNMDVMNAAGVDPSRLVTWDDFYDAGLVVLEKTGKPIIAVETVDFWLPQMMMLERNVQYVDNSGKPAIATEDHVEVITFIRKMMDAGICVLAPGGGYHRDDWFAFLNAGKVASICMPLWYMGRFTDYCPDLERKMAIYEIPVWTEGDVRSVLQGGTGTSVLKFTDKASLAKDFLAFAKLSEEGNRYEWEILGFDPIRTSLWDDPSVTNNPDNKFLRYFLTNPFDILKKNGTDLTAPNIRRKFAETYEVLISSTYNRVFQTEKDKDVMKILREEQNLIK